MVCKSSSSDGPREAPADCTTSARRRVATAARGVHTGEGAVKEPIGECVAAEYLSPDDSHRRPALPPRQRPAAERCRTTTE
eukprot:4598844-Prymnesium_polylepis.1